MKKWLLIAELLSFSALAENDYTFVLDMINSNVTDISDEQRKVSNFIKEDGTFATVYKEFLDAFQKRNYIVGSFRYSESLVDSIYGNQWLTALAMNAPSSSSSWSDVLALGWGGNPYSSDTWIRSIWAGIPVMTNQLVNANVSLAETTNQLVQVHSALGVITNQLAALNMGDITNQLVRANVSLRETTNQLVRANTLLTGGFGETTNQLVFANSALGVITNQLAALNMEEITNQLVKANVSLGETTNQLVNANESLSVLTNKVQRLDGFIDSFFYAYGTTMPSYSYKYFSDSNYSNPLSAPSISQSLRSRNVVTNFSRMVMVGLNELIAVHSYSRQNEASIINRIWNIQTNLNQAVQYLSYLPNLTNTVVVAGATNDTYDTTNINPLRNWISFGDVGDDIYPEYDMANDGVHGVQLTGNFNEDLISLVATLNNQMATETTSSLVMMTNLQEVVGMLRSMNETNDYEQAAHDEIAHAISEGEGHENDLNEAETYFGVFSQNKTLDRFDGAGLDSVLSPFDVSSLPSHYNLQFPNFGEFHFPLIDGEYSEDFKNVVEKVRVVFGFFWWGMGVLLAVVVVRRIVLVLGWVAGMVNPTMYTLGQDKNSFWG